MAKETAAEYSARMAREDRAEAERFARDQAAQDAKDPRLAAATAAATKPEAPTAAPEKKPEAVKPPQGMTSAAEAAALLAGRKMQLAQLEAAASVDGSAPARGAGKERAK